MPLLAACLLAGWPGPGLSAGTGAPSAAAVARWIDTAEPGVEDARGWAADILAVLEEFALDGSRENICSVIAIVDQESGFVENPPVPGLGAMAQKLIVRRLNELPAALGGQAKAYLERTPSPAASYMKMIRKARTERDLDWAYRKIVADLAGNWSLGLLLHSGLLTRLVESFNDIDTIGSMQTSVKFAVAVEEKKHGRKLSLEEIHILRDFMYTRRGGLKYGILLLLGYKAGYPDRLYMFADFNAGRYASRNAAVQKMVGRLARRKLSLDGDLLIYKDGAAAPMPSNTEKSLREVSSRLGIGLTDAQIRSDIGKEKSYEFVDTVTYRTLAEAYRREIGAEPPIAVVPEIALSSAKLSRRMTTRTFAETVKKRYLRCLRGR